MKKLICALMALGTGAVFVLGCSTLSKKSVQLSKIKDYQLKNGLKVLVLEDHSLPYLSVGLMVKTGAAADPLGKTGLANLTGDLFDRGSIKHSATEIADLFAGYGTGFVNSVNYDFSYFSTSSLAKDQENILNLFFEILLNPAFSDAEIERSKSESKAEIKRAFDQPSYVASRLFSQYLYAAHPYGRSTVGTLRDLDSIKNKDVRDFYAKYYQPNNSSLVLVGDVQPDLLAKLEVMVASWQSSTSPTQSYPSLTKLNGGELLLVDRDDLKQSEVRMGHFGIQRKNDDYQKIIVADVILSDGFTSRLMKEIRVKRGLTYGISSDFEARKDFGPFLIAAATRNEKVGDLVRETINVVKDFVKNGVTEQEVEDAKGYLRGAFPRKIETADQLAGLIMGLRFYGIDESYLENYVSTLNKISASEVNDVIKKYFHPDQFKVLVYAPKAITIDQLRPLGAVDVKPYKEMLSGM